MASTPENGSGTAAGKRTRTPSKSAKSPAELAPTAKKPRAGRKMPGNPPVAPSPVTASRPVVEDIDGMIATAAYYLAAERNFTPGCELDDWLAAERMIRARLHC